MRRTDCDELHMRRIELRRKERDELNATNWAATNWSSAIFASETIELRATLRLSAAFLRCFLSWEQTRPMRILRFISQVDPSVRFLQSTSKSLPRTTDIYYIIQKSLGCERMLSFPWSVSVPIDMHRRRSFRKRTFKVELIAQIASSAWANFVRRD